MQILVHQSLPGVNHEDNHVGVINCLQRFDNGELLHRFADVLPAPDTGCINQCVLFALALVRDIHAVTGGAGHIVNDHPLLTQHAVYQGRFTDVRPTDHTNTDAWIAICPVLFFPLFLRWQKDLQHGPDSPVMGGGNQEGGFKAKAVEIGRGNVRVLAIGLVYDQMGLLAGTAHLVSNKFITGG